MGSLYIFTIAHHSLPGVVIKTDGAPNYLQTQNPEHRRQIALDAAAAMRRPGVRLLLAEAPPEQLPYMQTPEFAEAVAAWRPILCAGNIWFYEKKAP